MKTIFEIKMSVEDGIDSNSVDRTAGSDICLSWQNVTVFSDYKRDFCGKNIVKKIFRVPMVNDEPNKILSSGEV